MSLMSLSLLADASKMSVSDLENIQETDTPPQSPSSQKVDSSDATAVEIKPQSASGAAYYFKVSHKAKHC